MALPRSLDFSHFWLILYIFESFDGSVWTFTDSADSSASVGLSRFCWSFCFDRDFNDSVDYGDLALIVLMVMISVLWRESWAILGFLGFGVDSYYYNSLMGWCGFLRFCWLMCFGVDWDDSADLLWCGVGSCEFNDLTDLLWIVIILGICILRCGFLKL